MKTAKPKILILTSNTGGGHMNLSKALKEELGEKYEVEIVDPHPGFVRQHYTILSRHFLKIWDLEYRYFDNERASLALQKTLGFFSPQRLPPLLERANPQLIISTHALLSYLVARAIERTGKKIPLAFYLTDLELTHTTWFTERNADAYLAPTREIFAQALRYGIDKSRLHITGRRVRKQFLQVDASRRAETLASLKLSPDVFTIFLQSGAIGSAGVNRTLGNLLTIERPVQIILAAGNNRSMASRFAEIENLRVLSFTETIAPYMAAADLIAGKAGASFITEAFMLEKPFLATAFIPGQEAPNLAFLERYNLGWTVLEGRSQRELITKLAGNPGMLAEKVASIRAYRAWNIEVNSRLTSIIEGLLVNGSMSS